MTGLRTLLTLLAVHLVGDFVLQTDWMGSNKSKDATALLAHVSVYSAGFLFWGWVFCVLTFILHLTVDAITSRITAHFWRQHTVGSAWNLRYGKFNPFVQPPAHWFFVGIGVDQFIHACCLAGVYWVLFR